MGEQNKIDRRLRLLERRRRKLARSLDAAYMKDSITESIALEDKYKNLNLAIQNLTHRRIRHRLPS